MLHTPADHLLELNDYYEINDCYPSSPIKKVPKGDQFDIDYADEYYDPTSSPGRVSQHVYTKDSPSIGTMSEYEHSSFDGDKEIPTMPIEMNHCNLIAESVLKFNRRWHYIKEPRSSASPYIYSFNPDISSNMRCKLVNWLIEVSLHFRLHRETFYLAVYYIDRFLSMKSNVLRSQLQLIGISAIFIAAKLEEIYPPSLAEFSQVCDGSCPTVMIAGMEIDIMMTLRWHLNVATPFYWLGCYVNILRPMIGHDFSQALFESVLEILDLTTHTSIFISYYYSVIATAALHIRLQSFKWLKYATGYDYEQIRPCVRAMAAFLNIPHALEFPCPEARISGQEFDRIIVRNNSILKQLLVLLA